MTEKVEFKRVASSFEQVENISLPPQSFLQDAWRRLKKNKGAVLVFSFWREQTLCRLMGQGGGVRRC